MNEDLEQACLNGEILKVSFLLENGISPNTDTRNNPKRSILISTCLHLERKVYCELNKLYNYINFLSFNQLKEIISLLLKHGGNPNNFDRVGKNAFHCSIKSGNIDIIKILLDNNADINLLGIGNISPLHIACDISWMDPIDIVNELLLRMADPMLKDCNEQMAVHHACQHGHVKCVKRLLEVAPSSVNNADVRGNTPIILAVQNDALINNCYDVVQILIGMDPSSVFHKETAHGRTALHYSAKYHNIEVTTLLLDAGSDVNTVDFDGKTPLHLAINNINYISKEKHYQLTKTLFEHGASPHIKDAFGCSVLETFLLPRRNLTARGRHICPVYQLQDDKVIRILEHHFFAGADFRTINQEALQTIEAKLLFRETDIIKRMIFHFGYPQLRVDYVEFSTGVRKFSFNNTEIELITELLKFQASISVKPLQCIAANTARLSLRPNAIKGLDLLNLSSHIKKLVLVPIN